MILIVDDNSENIFSLKSLLTLHQFEVDSALSGAEALKKVLQNSYSLIILDVQMPDMDGFEVAEAMSGYSKSKEIPIIFLSAVNTHKKFVTKGYASGGIDYVAKPFDPDILLLKIKTFYRLSEQTRQLNILQKHLLEEIELRKQAEEVLEKKVQERTSELETANRQLIESNKELQQFAFVASHDLQEPLRKIQLFSSMAMQTDMNEKEVLMSFLKKMNLAANRLRNLITDLLRYSQINEEKVFTRTDINKVIDETLVDLEILIQARKAVINVFPIPSFDSISSEMRQVFQNMISNSLKFRREEVPCIINIHGEVVDRKAIDAKSSPSGEYVRIIVEDNGIGFNPEYAHKIFEIFRRLNKREVYDGNGIGLAIVKKVIDRHNGIISANSEENMGTKFTIVLPRHQPLATTVNEDTLIIK